MIAKTAVLGSLKFKKKNSVYKLIKSDTILQEKLKASGEPQISTTDKTREHLVQGGSRDKLHSSSGG
jgi:hypothetical protein